MNHIGCVKNKNILFLQGPMGSFFKKMDTLFRTKGATTYKIGFNAGDRFYSHWDNYVPYKETRENYKTFIKQFLKENNINMIFLFGDCRFYQSISISVAKKLDIEVFVFEEGYIRPNFITMERFGVNAYSSISRDSKFYHSLKDTNFKKAKDVNYSQTNMFISATIYYLISNIFHFRYPNYIHHRDFSAIKESFYAIRSVLRKQIIYPLYEKGYHKLLSTTLSKKYFFVPLQTYNDFQILQHSGYKSVEKFIIEVLESFATNTTKEYIVFKHHPVDRGRKDYREFILEQASSYEIEDRVIVLYDTYLPTCLKNAKGTITINSTVGLSSLYHKTPTITLGNAIYDIDGLTSKGLTLKQFWKKQKHPDTKLLAKFRTYLVKHTQLNGSFYGDMPNFFNDN